MRLSLLSWRRLGAPLAVGAVVTVSALIYSNAMPRAATADKPAALASAAPLSTATYADAVSRVTPAVVTIEVEKRADAGGAMAPDDLFERFFGQNGPRPRQMPEQRETGLGSGVILTANGDIVTNNHVVEGADRVTVQLADGRQFPGKVLGTDPPTDLAVVHIDATGLPTVPVANSDRLRVGDVVLAVGNPLGLGETVTMGIVSAKGRATDLSDGSSYEDFIQTDAAINRGNSGGALVTTTGELVGINSQIMSPSGGNIGIGFAIPSNMAENVMTQLVSTGHVRRGMLGVTAQGMTSDMAQSLGLSSVQGAIVDQVNAGSPAEKAGLKQGDVILKVNGQPIDGSNSLRNRVSELAPGTSVTLDVFRHGENKQIAATLAEMTAADRAQPARGSSGSGELGMTLEALTPSISSRLNLPRGTTGVAVTDVDPSGAAARAGLRSGDVLTELNGQAVDSPAQVREVLSAHHDRPVLAAVAREGRQFYIAIPTR
jgi:Do/DeqQ family serine protease